MGLPGWVRRHRLLTAFAAGVFVTLVALAVAGYLILSDQRRTARVLAAALSQALAREVRIERVTDVGTERVVMRGVELPREGGWPVRVVAERVEATGPLLAAARGDPSPVRLTIHQPTVELPAGPSAGLAALDSVREAVTSFLGSALLLDVSLSGGTAQHAAGTATFDLALRKGRGEARAELTAREGRGAPLVVTVDARREGTTAKLMLAGHGGAAPVAGWLPATTATALRERTLALRVDVDLAGGSALTGRGNLAIGDLLAAGGVVTLKDGLLEATLPTASADLAFGAALAGLAWTPTGRAELSAVSVSWRPDGTLGPTIRAAVRVPALTLPAAAVGTEVAAERLEGRLALEPTPAGRTLSGDARATRLRAAGLETSPAETRYRLSLDAGGSVVRVDLEALGGRIEGAALAGSAAYDVGAHRLDARLEGEDVEAGGLVRRLLPGWLDTQERLRLLGLRVTAAGLDARTLEGGSTRLEARGLRWQRPSGELVGGRVNARADLAAARVALTLEIERLASTLAGLPGTVPRLTTMAELARAPGGGLQPTRATLGARNERGQEMLVAALQPAATPGRFRLSAHAPALDRLDGLWPAVPRRLNGTARLDVELAGPGYRAADGRLALSVAEAEMWARKVTLRDLEADVPIRRGNEFAGELPWGRLAIGELIAYGIVARDVTTPARVLQDRLSLNDLTYALYSGDGKGWSEIELEPAGWAARGQLTGQRVRVEEFISAYGIRGGTMTGLLRYDVEFQYRAGHPVLKGRLEVPEGGAVNIELLNRLLAQAEADPTGVLRQALENLREFDYKHAEAEIHSVGDDIRVSLALRGRERFWILPPRVREINIRNMPLSFLARQFPGAFN
ncbi:MAG TPA: hypothetical protein VGX21_01890 [Methylomirabilota bacterium]|jgi:hypothetical protein|nr:hypothetical protein [Methylomirabilota bacterium]